MGRFDSCISHVDDIEPREVVQAPPFGGRCHWVQISRATGGKLIELDIAVVPAGGKLSFLHWHTAREEAFYVLRGNPVLAIDGEEYQLRPGSVATRPANSGMGHQFLNPGQTEAWILGANNVPGPETVDETYRTEQGVISDGRTRAERPM